MDKEGEEKVEETREGGSEGGKEGEGGKKDKTKSNKNFISCWILSFFIVKYNLLCKKYKKILFHKKKYIVL